MAVLFKSPPAVIDGDIIRLTAPMFGDVRLEVGDRIFLWWSETHDGRGLAGHGLCVSAIEQARSLVAEVEPITTRDVGFGRAQLRPHRNALGTGPHVTLSLKLYRHALNKAVAITPHEEAFLLALFD